MSFISRGFFGVGWGVRTVTLTSRSSPFRSGVVGDFHLASRLFLHFWCGARSLLFISLICFFGLFLLSTLFLFSADSQALW